MTKTKNFGISQLPNGNWCYRFTRTVDGKRVNRKSSKDEAGNPLKTQREAIQAKTIAEMRFDASLLQKPAQRMTFGAVYAEYCEHGRSGKAYSTIRKQDSLWRNHLEEKFALRYVDGISAAEVNDYLSFLYYTEGRAYRYVEGFLKMFYLVFGQAYSRNYLAVDAYNKLCVNKDTRICMPKMKIDDDMDIVAFSREETDRLDAYFKGTNAETAYLLGRFCGLRINECYGLKWQNIDIEQGTIIIDRQMQYQEGLIKLVPLKTRNSRRTVYMNQRLREYFIELDAKTKAYAAVLEAQRAQNSTYILDVDGEKISSLELANTLPNGKMQTVNSMKYHSRTIKAKLQIDFKYHYLRHTYGTRLAELNTPTHILCNQMGHASGKVTERYYLAVSQTGIDILGKNLEKM